MAASDDNKINNPEENVIVEEPEVVEEEMTVEEAIDLNPKSANEKTTEEKQKEEERRREAERKRNISAVYWDEYTDMAEEKEAKEVEQYKEDLEKRVALERMRLREASKVAGQATKTVITSAGTILVSAADGVGKVVDAVEDAIHKENEEEAEADPTIKPYETEPLSSQDLAPEDSLSNSAEAAPKQPAEDSEVEKVVSEAQKSAEKAIFWLGENGANLLEYSAAFIHAISERLVDGKSEPVHKIAFNEDFENAIDRDKVTPEEYQKYIETVNNAKNFFKENEDVLNDTLNSVHQVQLGDEDPEKVNKINSVLENEAVMSRLREFNKILSGLKEKDDFVCKLTNQKKQPVLVEPLKQDEEFSPEMKAKESSILDTCHNMLSAPIKGLASKEYQNIMDSVQNAKSTLNQEYDSNEAAKKAYTKSVHKVLNDINRYRVHMASQNFALDDTLKEEIVAVERVDKFFRTRFQTLEQREYEDTIGGVGELFKVEIDKNAVGDDYVFQNGLGKINNMKKKIEDFKEEAKAAKENGAGEDELEVFINNPLEREVLPVEPEKENEPERVEDEHLKEQRDIEKEEKKEEKKELEEGEKANDLKADVEREEKELVDPNRQQDVLRKPEVQKEPDVRPTRKKNTTLEKNLEEIFKNDLLQEAIKKEEDYRKNLEPKDEYGVTQLVLSAKKSIYLELLGQAAGKKMAVMDKEKVEDILNKGIKDFNKSAIKARAFMAEHVYDKDFNQEFGKRVIEGAKDGKTSQEDIKNFRDEALKSCYLDHKGKDIKALDKLSEMLGSNVNARSLGLVKDRVLEKKLPEEMEKKIAERRMTPNKPLGLGM